MVALKMLLILVYVLFCIGFVCTFGVVTVQICKKLWFWMERKFRD